MGTRMAPSYAILFLAKFGTIDAVTHGPHQPHTWWRFEINDIFMIIISTHTEDELRTFITYLNNILHTIKFPLCHLPISTSFLEDSQFGRVVEPTGRQTPIPSTIIVSPPTKASHFSPMTSSNIVTIVDTTSLFSNTKSKEFTKSHAMKHSIPVSQTTTKKPSRVPLVISYNLALRSMFYVNYHTKPLYHPFVFPTI